MEVRDGQTKARGGLESTRRCVHADCGRLEWVVRWEHQCTPILAVVVWSVGWSGEDIVPSVEQAMVSTPSATSRCAKPQDRCPAIKITDKIHTPGCWTRKDARR